LAWIIKNGPIPKGKIVKIKCGNPRCVRHLYLSTRSAPIEVRFWRRVKKTRTCWLWTGYYRRENGYGQIAVKIKGIRRPMSVHRVAWTLAHGPIPKGKEVLHKCDIRLCVRDSHLFLGTQLENNQDMMNKGRQAKGERHAWHKLPEKDVIEIRRLLKGGLLSKRKIARQFGVSPSNVRLIEKRQTWKHLK
jgi:hypothetical protein